MSNSDKIAELQTRYLNVRLKFNTDLIDSVNGVLGDNNGLTADIDVENNLVVVNANDEADLVECIVYYDVRQQRPCAKLVVQKDESSYVLMDIYLSLYQIQTYHELISTIQAISLFQHVDLITRTPHQYTIDAVNL